MAKSKAPPPRRDNPDYNPEPPPREELGDDVPGVREHKPERNRSAPSAAVLITIAVVVVLALAYFLTRGQ